jgi:hypothetical protein
MSQRGARYFALLVVIALHCAVIAVLVASSKARRNLSASPAPIELLFFPPSPAVAAAAAAAKIPSDTSLPKPTRTTHSNSVAVPELTLTPNAAAPQQSSGAPIDWAREAQSVAAAIAAKPTSPRLKDETTTLPPKSIFPEAPAHHAGDEFTTVSGERAVFVSEHCYQVSRTQLPDASNTGMVNPTYCIGKSKTPRGDLFDRLPAYQKYHSN